MKQLYCVFDRVIGEFAPPFPAPNHVHAVRLFQAGLKDVEFPDDYRLYHVGYFDINTGQLVQDLADDDNPHEVDTADVLRQILSVKEGK